MTLAELVMLAFSLGALRSSWKGPDDNYSEVLVEMESDGPVESKSLYDLMAHFPMNKDITCPGSDSRFRYPGECTRYVTCRNYRAHIRSCPPGMSFDPTYEHCRLSFEVDCVEQLRLQTVCGVDEVYSDCGCESKCGLDEDTECEIRCIAGCFCRYGLYRDGAGKCVDKCPDSNNLAAVLFGSHRNCESPREQPI